MTWRERVVGLMWTATFFAYGGVYYGWLVRAPINQDLAGAFRLSYVLVFGCILAALQLRVARDRWIVAAGTFEGVVMLAALHDLWEAARGAFWLANILLSCAVLWYALVGGTRRAAVIALLAVCIAPAALAVAGGIARFEPAGRALLGIQLGYGVVVLTCLLLVRAADRRQGEQASAAVEQ